MGWPGVKGVTGMAPLVPPVPPLPPVPLPPVPLPPVPGIPASPPEVSAFCWLEEQAASVPRAKMAKASVLIRDATLSERHEEHATALIDAHGNVNVLSTPMTWQS